MRSRAGMIVLVVALAIVAGYALWGRKGGTTEESKAVEERAANEGVRRSGAGLGPRSDERAAPRAGSSEPAQDPGGPVERTPSFAEVEALLPQIEAAKDETTHEVLMHELVVLAARLDYRDQMKAREKMLEMEQRRAGIVPKPLVAGPIVVLNPDAKFVEPPAGYPAPSPTTP